MMTILFTLFILSYVWGIVGAFYWRHQAKESQRIAENYRSAAEQWRDRAHPWPGQEGDRL